jgi:hypothetical protein
MLMGTSRNTSVSKVTDSASYGVDRSGSGTGDAKSGSRNGDTTAIAIVDPPPRTTHFVCWRSS